jgi:folate-binding protein YgfZ
MTTVPLAFPGVIRATGADASAFLHGQLTADLATLPVDHALPAAWCTAKGRVLATFVVLHLTDQWLLITDREQLPALLKRLSMFVMRARVKLEDASGQWRVLGLMNDAATGGLAPVNRPVNLSASQPPSGPPWAIGRADGRLQIEFDPGQGLILEQVESASALIVPSSPVDARAEGWWRAAEITAGRPWVSAATQEAHTPQMLNLDLIGAVSFTKGCYPGQEIVARTRYLGRVKRRLLCASTTATTPASAGMAVSGADGQLVGEVLDAATDTHGRQKLLFVAQLDALALLPVAGSPGGTSPVLHLGDAQGPSLVLQPLPYALEPDPPTASGAATGPA